MTHVPDDAVFGGVEHVVQGDAQLDRPQVGREMSSRARHRFDEKGTQFMRERYQIPAFERTQFARMVDTF